MKFRDISRKVIYIRVQRRRIVQAKTPLIIRIRFVSEIKQKEREKNTRGVSRLIKKYCLEKLARPTTTCPFQRIPPNRNDSSWAFRFSRTVKRAIPVG